MHIKIYFGEKAIILCDQINEEIQQMLQHTTTPVIESNDEQLIQSFIKNINNDNFTTGLIISSDFVALKNTFFSQFVPIEASGGVVENTSKEILFIYRLGKWDLPKGKVEPDEDIATTATREVAEETGITKLQLKNKIGETYHTYHAHKKYFIKTTHWYHLTCSGKQILRPQTEEDIEEAKWVSTEKIKKLMDNTYPSIQDILHKFLKR